MATRDITPAAGQPAGVPTGSTATRKPFASFDVMQIAASLPETAETLLVDHRMTDEPEASARVFRVYKPTPAHYHQTCDEYLYVLSGRATFFMGDQAPREVGPGQLLFFKKGTVHGMPTIIEHPVAFLSVDTPRRDPRDIIFVDPSAGTVEGFVRPQGTPGADEKY
jgi:mannose-6-phosphate isomerase-like protein (cupin superfamily)